MRDELPAALPLTALVTGLATAGIWQDARAACAAAFAIALLAGVLLHRRGSGALRAVATAAFFTAGILLATRDAHLRLADENAIRALDPDRFASVTAPLDRDWSPRGDSWMLRLDEFSLDGRTIHRPLRLYARFEPPPIALHGSVVAEGVVRLSERGDAVMSVKAPQLLSYRGTIDRRSPRTWNRLAAMKTAAASKKHPVAASLVDALLLGRGERLSDETRESFRRGGTYHLLVFSGLQITFAAAILAFSLRWLRAPRASDWLLLAFAALAPSFAGAASSVSRASVAIALYACSRILARPTSYENLWCLAALLRLLAVPGDLVDPAFHLTFAGAGALLFLGKPFSRSRMRQMAYVIAAELVIAPLTLFHFHQVALGGSIATLVMTPVIFAMLALSAAFCATGSDLLLRAIEQLDRLCSVVNVLAGHGSTFFASPPVWSVIAAGLAALLALALTRGRMRPALLAAAMMLPAGSAIVRHVVQRSARPSLVALDVGQGDAILLRDGRSTVLIDGGGRADDPRFGEMTLLPMLVDRGVRRIDTVVLTHAHPDHCGGLPAVLRHLEVGELAVNARRLRGPCTADLLAEAADAGIPVRMVRDGETRWSGTIGLTTWITPWTARRAPENNSSVVLRARVGPLLALLAGDIEREAEIEMEDRPLRADVLKVAHHGSRSSSSERFLAAVAPSAAVISCGRGNLFGHPHADVLSRLTRARIVTYRTDLLGTIELRLDRSCAGQPQIDTPE